MMEEDNVVLRRWGSWKELAEGKLDSDESYKIKLLYIQPGKSISLQYHEHRSEEWLILQGEAECKFGRNGYGPVDGDKNLMTGYTSDVQDMFCSGIPHVSVSKNTVHKITNIGENVLVILELQIGKKTEEDDIIRLEKIDGKDDNSSK